jgi:hypothetical protein
MEFGQTIADRFAIVVLVAAAWTSAAGADDGSPTSQPLVDLTTLASPQLEATRGEISVTQSHGEKVLLLRPTGSGNASCEIKPTSPWDCTRAAEIVIPVRNGGQTPLIVRAAASNADGAGQHDSVRGAVPLAASSEETQLVVRLVRRPDDPGYARFKPFYMYTKSIQVHDNTIDPRSIARLTIAIDEGPPGAALEIGPISTRGEAPADSAPFLPFVDRYGQYVHSDWPGKIYTDQDFANRREEEAKERAAWPGPKNWDRYGGWAAGPTLKSTGFFYPTRHAGKWWLVDPDGRVFWSYGPTGVGFGGDLSPVNDREQWFRDLPPRDDPQFGRFYRRGHGALYMYYRGREWVGFDFAAANLLRKYGEQYQQAVAELSHQRLRSWGFNSIGNWSSPQIYGLHRMPYTVAIHYGSPMIHERMPDVYSPAWEKSVRARMEQERSTTAGNPWNIGYFVDNERWWGWQPRAAAVGEETLRNPPDAPAKREFIDRLQKKYSTIEALNAAWATTHPSWNDLSESREAPNLKNPQILADCGDFGMAFAERYFATVRDAVKSVAPNNLYLGCRFNGHIDPDLVRLAGKYCDVVSYNIYDNPPEKRVAQYVQLDLPMLASEWGIDSDPVQTPFRGDEKQATTDPQQRVREMVRYFDHAIRHPNLVGAHFFQYRDQPISGRPDGEAVLRGFVNIADTPNFDLVHANRAAAYELYEKLAK